MTFAQVAYFCEIAAWQLQQLTEGSSPLVGVYRPLLPFQQNSAGADARNAFMSMRKALKKKMVQTL